jgi:uncharacterized protein
VLKVNVADLLRQLGSRRGVRRDAHLDGLVLSTSRVPDDAVVAVDVTLESVPNGVMAYGTVTAPWVGACRRCLRDATGEATTRVRELFERRPTEGETYRLAGEEVDLEPLVRESVLLELPLAPLCADDCRGLCPQCGADLNEGECDCPAVETDPRWAALDELRFDP